MPKLQSTPAEVDDAVTWRKPLGHVLTPSEPWHWLASVMVKPVGQLEAACCALGRGVGEVNAAQLGKAVVNVVGVAPLFWFWKKLGGRVQRRGFSAALIQPLGQLRVPLGARQTWLEPPRTSVVTCQPTGQKRTTPFVEEGGGAEPGTMPQKQP